MSASYWQRDAAWRDRFPASSLPQNVDFAVVGGGISGLSAAIQLRKLHPGADILVVEAKRVGYGASGRNAGFLSPVAAPVWLIGASRCPDQAWGVAHVNERTHASARWLSKHLADCELRPATLSIQATGTVTAGGLGEFARCLEIAGLPYQWAHSHARRKRVCLGMDAHTVHPYKLVLGLANYATRTGVHIREQASVRAVTPAALGARLHLHNGAHILARRAIICTNAFTSDLDLGQRVHARAIRSFMIASAPLATRDLRALNRNGDFAVELNTAETYSRLHDNRILYGGYDTILRARSDNFAVPSSIKRKLAKRLRRSTTQRGDISVAHSWAGSFHATLTGLPIIGPSKRTPAIVLNVGYAGTGVALALVCAPLVAALSSGHALDHTQTRLLSLIHTTTVPVWDTIRAAVRVAHNLATPWLRRTHK